MIFDRAHREFFWLLVRRDLKVRYAGSTLGALWNLIHPLMMIAIYMTIFSALMRWDPKDLAEGAVDYGRLTYGVHLVSGLLVWLVFSDVLTRSTSVLIDNSNFLQKVSFPPIVLFLSVLFNALFVYGVGFLGFLGALVALGKPVPAAALSGLVLMVLIGVAGVGLGLILASLNMFLRDVAQILAVVMQLLFWFNPIVYPKEILFGAGNSTDQILFLKDIGRVILTLNPFERFITAAQNFFGLAHQPLGAVDWAIVFVFPFVCLFAGLYLFRRLLPDIRDCL